MYENADGGVRGHEINYPLSILRPYGIKYLHLDAPQLIIWRRLGWESVSANALTTSRLTQELLR